VTILRQKGTEARSDEEKRRENTRFTFMMGEAYEGQGTSTDRLPEIEGNLPIRNGG